MEFYPDVGSQRNKGILVDDIRGPLIELRIQRRSQEVEASGDCKPVGMQHVSIVIGA